MTAILGISAFYHDSAAALVVDGNIVAAAQEERFTRIKNDHSFPVHAIAYCLREAGLTPEQIDYIGFYDKPLLKFDRLLETYLDYAPAGFRSFLRAMPLWLKQKLHLPREMRNALNGAYKKRFIFTEHHESHAASAFFASPFDEAAILTIDGVGEWATASFGTGRGNKLSLSHEIRFPHSVGLLYSAFTYYCGFKVNEGEYKLMGLAPYGEPTYTDLIFEHLVDLRDDGSIHLDMSYFNYCQGLTMTSKKFEDLFGGPPRKPDGSLTQRDMEIAASIQKVAEEIMLRMARHIHATTGMKNLCMAGGVALNCVGNGRILRESPFEKIWIQPAAGDAGGALGVALFTWYQLLDNPRTAIATDEQHGSQLGKEYSDSEIEAYLQSVNAPYDRMDDEDTLTNYVADAIADGSAVGWFQGRMEFGPRALGFRSILGDARNPEMQSTINMKVKFREGFRPFAPIVLAEHAHEYFDIEPGQESPYMLIVAPVRDDKRLESDSNSSATGINKLKQQRSVIPAVTHVDYSARLQTVDAERHGRLYRMMSRFYEKTDCPVLINTSFNLGWSPIVCSPRDAYETFMSCEIDMLCMGNFVLTKDKQPGHVATEKESADFLVERLTSPCCQADVVKQDAGYVCAACNHAFPDDDGIARLFWPHEQISNPDDVTNVVKAFYEETPFPNYDEHDSIRSLIEKSRGGRYARKLNETIPFNSTVLEVGCGTGQLSNFLGLSCRHVVGTDMCLNSLKLGEAFRKESGLTRVNFMQMNLFRPALKREQFDVVLCNGVLHHTADPYGGFKSILSLVKPGGYIVVGLYNTYGRLLTDLRRHIFRLTGNGARWIDPILRRNESGSEKHRAWFADQYEHPHESKHTFGEVLTWFDETGLEFVRGIPALRPDDDGLAGENLFEAQQRGNRLEHFLVQATEILAAGQKEGGFFIMIARKPAVEELPAVTAVEEQAVIATEAAN